MVPPHPAPDLVMSQASFALGPFQRRFDPGPMGPHLNQLAQSDLKRRIAQSVIDPGMCLDGPHHDQPLFRPIRRSCLALTRTLIASTSRGSLSPSHHQADPAEGALPCSPCIGTNEGDLTFPTDAGFPAQSWRRSRSRIWVLHGTSRRYHWPHARRFARNSADRPNSSSPTTQRWGNRGPLRFKRSEAICHLS